MMLAGLKPRQGERQQVQLAKASTVSCAHTSRAHPSSAQPALPQLRWTNSAWRPCKAPLISCLMTFSTFGR